MRLADVPMSTNVVDLCECLPKSNLHLALEVLMNAMLLAGVFLLFLLVVDIATTNLREVDYD